MTMMMMMIMMIGLDWIGLSAERGVSVHRFHVMQITCMSIFMSICTSVLFMFPSHRPLSLYGAIKPGLKPHRGAWER